MHSFYERSRQVKRKKGKKGGGRKMITEIVATDVVANQPPEWQLTAKPMLVPKLEHVIDGNS